MLQIATAFLLLLVSAPLILGSYGFQNAGTSAVSWATSLKKLQVTNAKDGVRFVNSNHQRLVVLHHLERGHRQVGNNERSKRIVPVRTC